MPFPGLYLVPRALRSLVTVCRQVILCLPLILFPVGVHLNATFGILSLGSLKICPSHFNVQFFISFDTFLLPVFLCRSSLEVLLGRWLLQSVQRELLWKGPNILIFTLVTLQVCLTLVIRKLYWCPKLNSYRRRRENHCSLRQGSRE